MTISTVALLYRPLAHIPSIPRHSTRSAVTYWCALAREDGSMEVIRIVNDNVIINTVVDL